MRVNAKADEILPAATEGGRVLLKLQDSPLLGENSSTLIRFQHQQGELAKTKRLASLADIEPEGEGRGEVGSDQRH